MFIKTWESLEVSLLLEDGNESVYPVAYIFNQDNVLLAQKSLTHVWGGLYVDGSYVVQPNDLKLKVVYIVYADAAHTIFMEHYSRELDYFERLDVTVNVVVHGSVSDCGLVGKIECECSDVVGYIEDSELVFEVETISNLVLKDVDIDEDMIGFLENNQDLLGVVIEC